MSKFIGYLTNEITGLVGERGQYYDYVTAGNGVFIEVETELMAARVDVAPGKIRGLADLKSGVVLRHGLIPQSIGDMAIDVMLANPSYETYIGIGWRPDGYYLYYPNQKNESYRVEYEVGNDIVMDLHSHAQMKPFFSLTDTLDEQGFRIYGVIGNLNRRPNVMMRIGVYGYFEPIQWSDVFDGELIDVIDCSYYGYEEDEFEIRKPGPILLQAG